MKKWKEERKESSSGVEFDMVIMRGLGWNFLHNLGIQLVFWRRNKKTLNLDVAGGKGIENDRKQRVFKHMRNIDFVFCVFFSVFMKN